MAHHGKWRSPELRRHCALVNEGRKSFSTKKEQIGMQRVNVTVGRTIHNDRIGDRGNALHKNIHPTTRETQFRKHHTQVASLNAIVRFVHVEFNCHLLILPPFSFEQRLGNLHIKDGIV